MGQVGSCCWWTRCSIGLVSHISGRFQGANSLSTGTKLHQQPRKAISKHRPALMTAIRKFNKYCETLERLYDPTWKIPLPLPLSLQLATLRDQPGLMEDVWITPSSGKTPCWLGDADVRDGIRAMLKLDRCAEESKRLHREAANITQWLQHERDAVELVLSTPSCESDHLTRYLGSHNDRFTSPCSITTT